MNQIKETLQSTMMMYYTTTSNSSGSTMKSLFLSFQFHFNCTCGFSRPKEVIVQCTQSVINITTSYLSRRQRRQAQCGSVGTLECEMAAIRLKKRSQPNTAGNVACTTTVIHTHLCYQVENLYTVAFDFCNL